MFRPSISSAVTPVGYGTADWAAIIEAASGIASGVISTVGASEQQQAQYEYQQLLGEQQAAAAAAQAELAELQAQQSQSLASQAAAQAEALIAQASAQKTKILIGGAVLLGLGGLFYLSRR